ncbi:MAG: hypothetical protein AAF570_19365, partial [Bacteroidota bacterium]
MADTGPDHRGPSGIGEFAEDITADVDLESGAVDGLVRLESGVYLSSITEVCPRCVSSGGIGSTGTCSGGRSPGRSCTVEGTVR